MNSKAIYQKANALVRQTGTRDAEKIAKDIGIWIFDEPYLSRSARYVHLPLEPPSHFPKPPDGALSSSDGDCPRIGGMMLNTGIVQKNQRTD